ncbi:MAG TPA: GntR family transcriptional regulator [Acidimicrobiales bacterium]
MSDLRAATDERIRIPKAAELVANTLRRRIITGEYKPDELLPPEGALMSSFNVARTTVRDAFRVLESEGLVVVRRGANGGGRVRVPSVSMVSDNASVLLQYRGATLEDVHQGRLMVEVPVAGMLASRKARKRIVRELREALAEEEASIADPVELPRAEGRFHLRLIELADSPTISMLSAVTNRIIAQQVVKNAATRQTGDETIARHREAHAAHERLVDLIDAGSAAQAEALWRRHLEGALQQLLSSPGTARTVIELLS